MREGRTACEKTIFGEDCDGIDEEDADCARMDQHSVSYIDGHLDWMDWELTVDQIAKDEEHGGEWKCLLLLLLLEI